MRRGTTPTLVFTVPFETDTLAELYITFEQDLKCKKVTLEKTLDDATLGEKTVSVTLTQQETIMFNEQEDVFIQFRVKYNDGGVDASNIIRTEFRRILKEGVI